MELPLHPAIVHLPIGLAFLLPLLGLGVAFAIARAWLPRTSWMIVVFVASLAASTAVFAQRTGEEEERRLERVLQKDAVHAHEEAAERFVIAAVALALACAALMFLRHELGFRAGSFALGLLGFGVLGTGLWAGRKGAELVWIHGAANAPKAASTPAGAQ